MKVVYCLDFPDGKRYVGSTVNLRRRMIVHRCSSGNAKSNPELREAIAKGGYEVVILQQCPDDYTIKQLRDREQHYVNLWWDYGILYNKNKNVIGGHQKRRVSPNKGNKYSSAAYQRADEIRADRAAGMHMRPLLRKYKTSFNVLKDILAA